MAMHLDHILPASWMEGLTLEEIEILKKAVEDARRAKLEHGARFDFFGGASLDLNSVFVSPDRGDSVLEYFNEEMKQVA